MDNLRLKELDDDLSSKKKKKMIYQPLEEVLNDNYNASLFWLQVAVRSKVIAEDVQAAYLVMRDREGNLSKVGKKLGLKGKGSLSTIERKINLKDPEYATRITEKKREICNGAEDILRVYFKDAEKQLEIETAYINIKTISEGNSDFSRKLGIPKVTGLAYWNDYERAHTSKKRK